MAVREQIYVFTRFPEAGKTKTRLIPRLGASGAARLQRRMTEHVVTVLSALANGGNVRLSIAHAGGDEEEMRRWLGPEVGYWPQPEGDLGNRMTLAFRTAFAGGSRACVLVGSDCPVLDCETVSSAFRALRDRDLVLGPARDGGYYLIGLRATACDRAASVLFRGMPWGTEEVLVRTLAAAGKADLTRELLPEMADVDRPEDLAVWEEVARSSPALSGEPRLSVIIPALNEEENVAHALAVAHTGANVELVVVDGGSSDRTPTLAAEHGARVIASKPGRAGQMNTGAREATGDILLFLHADTVLPLGYDTRVRRSLLERRWAAGAFRLAIAGESTRLRFIAAAANWRSRALKLPYGDQALFFRRGVFEEAGGFPEQPIMEDFELMRRLRRRKRKTGLLPVAVRTSARRWEKLGPWRTFGINQAIILAYRAGVPPACLAAWYRR